MDEKQFKASQKILAEAISACYVEFCEFVGDSPCGCDACPYQQYNTDDEEYGCEDAYLKDKLDALKKKLK